MIMRKLYKSLKQNLLRLSDLVFKGSHFYCASFQVHSLEMHSPYKANVTADSSISSRFFNSFLSQLKKVQTL
jgi:hypothetical protein